LGYASLNVRSDVPLALRLLDLLSLGYARVARIQRYEGFLPVQYPVGVGYVAFVVLAKLHIEHPVLGILNEPVLTNVEPTRAGP